MKIKVIQISHASHSYFANENDDLKKIVLNDWYFKVATQLRKFHPEIEVECWAPEKLNKKYEEYFEDGIKMKFFPVTFSPRYALDFSKMMIKALKKEVEKSRREKYKLIFHLHEIHNLHGLVIATKFKKEKLIVQHHGGSWPSKHLRENKDYKKFFPLFLIGQIWESFVLKNIKVFYGLSKEEIDYIKNKNKNVRFQTMGIDNEYFKLVDKKTARKKLKLPLNEKIIIFLGRITNVKGVGVLLEAMKQLKDVKLKLMGYGKERENFEKYVKKNNLKNVEFLGGVFGEEKLLYLSAADALILPSSKEGAPVTVMEAMAKNLLPVVTNIGGVPLMIEDEKNGIIIKKMNAEEVVKSVKKALEWKSNNLQESAERYKWEKIIKDTVEDYKRI